MTPDRWRQIEELYHSARDRGVAVLEGTDPELRREVERLLAQDSDGKILDLPAVELLDEFAATEQAPEGRWGSPDRLSPTTTSRRRSAPAAWGSYIKHSIRSSAGSSR